MRRHAATIGRAAFLFPVARSVPERGLPPSMTNDSDATSATTESVKTVSTVCRRQAGRGGLSYPAHGHHARARLGDPDDVHEERVAAAARPRRRGRRRRLRRAVSARTRSSGASCALLHDFDYEIHPTLDKHPQDGAPILREEGWPEEVVETVLSHAEHLAMPRDTPLKRTLFACDELAGLRPRVRARAAGRDRDARAEVGEEEAEAAVVRRGREPRRRLTRAPSRSGSSSTSTSRT